MLLSKFGLFVIALLVSLVASSAGSSVEVYASSQSVGEPTPNLPLQELEAVRKRVVLRILEGEPVPGIEVQLMPAGSDLGGPPVAMPAQQATTDIYGSVTFSGLGEWVWMVSFKGTFRGQPLQPVSEQGLSPWGRTRKGGGFPVLVQRQEEDEAAPPLVENGVRLPEVQPSLFVLVPTQASLQEYWAPTIDLALPGERPQPLAAPSVLSASVVEPLPTSASGMIAPGTVVPGTELKPQSQPEATSMGETGETVGSLVRWLYILPLAVAAIALYKAWQQRKQEQSQQEHEQLQELTREEEATH